MPHWPRMAWVALIALVWSSAAFASVLLPVKHHKQERELSCEAAALRMVLDYFGLKVTEEDIIRKMPVDATPKRDGIWGDPDLGFVGDIDGVMGKTGYGIHWNALARVASNWKRTIVLGNGSLADLISNLDQRRPVIIWGVDGPLEKLSWKTPQGRTVLAMTNEHARVVYGYRGTREKPTSLYVMDPRHGPQITSIQEFLAGWDSFGRKAIVLFP